MRPSGDESARARETATAPVTSEEDALRAKVLDSFKVVCICNKIKKGTILKAIAGGAKNLGDVKRATRAGTGACGTQRGGVTRCTAAIREMLEEAKRARDLDTPEADQ